MTRNLRLFLVLLGIAALAFGYRHLARNGKFQQSSVEKLAELATRDKSTLLSPDAIDTEVFGALVRLGSAADPLARQEAVKRARSPSKLIREGAANALGSYDDEESFSTLRTLTADSEKDVRVQALQAIGRRPSEARRALLNELLAKRGLAAEERVAASASLAKLGGKPGDVAASVATLTRIATSDADDVAATRAANEALALAPRDSKVADMLRTMLESGKRKGIVSTGVRHLAALRDPWLIKNHRKFLQHENPQVRLAVLQSLHFLCPSDRWTILEGVILGERDRSLAEAALLAPRFMPGGEARALLQRLIASGKLAGQELSEARIGLAQLEKSTEVDPCLNHQERRK